MSGDGTIILGMGVQGLAPRKVILKNEAQSCVLGVSPSQIIILYSHISGPDEMLNYFIYVNIHQDRTQKNYYLPYCFEYWRFSEYTFTRGGGGEL